MPAADVMLVVPGLDESEAMMAVRQVFRSSYYCFYAMSLA
jgi:hypothetical protein